MNYFNYLKCTKYSNSFKSLVMIHHYHQDQKNKLKQLMKLYKTSSNKKKVTNAKQ